MAKAISRKSVSIPDKNTTTKFWQHKNFYQWLVFGVAFLLFANSIPGNYNMDDELVTINHRLTSKGISAIPEIFSSPYYQDESGYAYEYRPLVLMTFAIEHQFFGDNAHVSHFFNVLLYALCCLVLYKVLSKLFKSYSPFIALAVTLLFVAHPAHTEVVCSIKNRDEILSLLFALLSLLVTLRGLETSRKWWFVLTPVMFTLALMAKATVVSFVVILPLALIFFTGAGFWLIMLVAVLMMAPAYFLLEIDNGLDKIMFLSGAALSSVVIYVIIHFKSSFNATQAFITGTIARIIAIRPSKNSETSDGAGKFKLRLIFDGAVPQSRFFSASAIILTAFLATSYLLLALHAHSLVALIPMAFMALLAWKGEERISYWAIIAIGVCLVGNVFSYKNVNNSFIISPYCEIVGLYLLFQVYFGIKILRIPLLFLYFLCAAFCFYAFHNHDLPTLLLLFCINYAYVRYFILVMFGISIIGMYPYSHLYDYFELLKIATIYVVVLAFQFKKDLRGVPFIILVSALILFHSSQFSQDRQIPVQKTIVKIKDLTNQLNPKFFATAQNRPLNDAEETISQSSPMSVRLGTSFQILFLYLGKVVLPYQMSFYYGPKFIYAQKMDELVPIVSLILHLVLLALALFFLKRERLISFALFVYLVGIAIFSNFFIPVPGMFADRFLSLPSLGWVIIVVIIVLKAFKVGYTEKVTQLNAVPKNARYVFMAVLLLYAGISFSRNLNWFDDLTLMEHDISYVSQSAQAQSLLGIHLVKKSFTLESPEEQRKLRVEAVGHLERAHAIFPNYFNFVYDVGRVFTLLNVPDSALGYFQKAYVINPEFEDVPASIASIYFNKGDFQASIPYFEKAMELRPQDFSLPDRLSFAYFKTNQIELSVKTNADAIRRIPGRMEPFINIATCYININKRDSAMVWLNRALAVSPNDPVILNYMKKMQ